MLYRITLFLMLFTSLNSYSFTVNSLQLEKGKCSPLKVKNQDLITPNFISLSEQASRFDDLTISKSLQSKDSLLKALDICAFYTYTGNEKEYKTTYQYSRISAYNEYIQNQAKYKSLCNFPYKFIKGNKDTLCYSNYIYAIFEEKKGELHSDILKRLSSKHHVKFKKFQTGSTEFGSSEGDTSENTNVNIYVYTYHAPSNPRDSITSIVYFHPKLIEWSQVNMEYLVNEYKKLE